MGQRYRPTSLRPPEWQPLVSSRQWMILADAIGGQPRVLDDLRVVLSQLSPRVREALLGNLVLALAWEASPSRAVWTALLTTGHELRLSSAEALGRWDRLEEQP